MADMLINLYGLENDLELLEKLQSLGIKIIRALAPDKNKIMKFIRENVNTNWPNESGDSWLSECEAAMANNPPTCILAVKDKRIIGFSCYNATGKGFFGPTGVLIEFQRKGLGKAMLLRSLFSMREEGYGYAIIGWPAKDAIVFYEKTVNAIIIPNSSPGIYSRLIDFSN